ncbi:hypothetical protein B9Z19DRAFT_1173096 [Tuber borchii]|uniref:Uncharacterized protein n=1 Tax=Tuber borchii TaxID=42251 RepID=A0A2T6ZXL2_TUBBO|nr:hypothetical protein B9Z19DRAFT_1173096 [Tuber borchii]
MEDSKTIEVSNSDQELPTSGREEPTAKNYPKLILRIPLKSIASRDQTKESVLPSSSLLPSKTSHPEMPDTIAPHSQILETELTGVPNRVASETPPTENFEQGGTQREEMSTKSRTRSAAAKTKEKADSSGSSLQEPTPVPQSPRYPRRHITRQTALVNRSPTVGATSNSFLQSPSPTRRRQKEIMRTKRANGEVGEPTRAGDTGSGNGEKGGEEMTKPPEGRNDSEEPRKFFFTMKGPHESGLKHLAAAIDPLPQATGSHNQPVCPLADDEADLSDRIIKPNKGKGPENKITSQSGSLLDEYVTSPPAPLSPPSIQNASDHNTLQEEESDVDVSGRGNEYDATNLRPFIEAFSSQEIHAHYASYHPEMNTPEQLLLNISQNPIPPMADSQFRAMPVQPGQRYNYYTETQCTVYIWASGPWPPSPTTRWNRFNITSSSPVALLFEYIGRNRPDTGLVEIGGGVIAHYLGDVRRYRTRMDQAGWPTTLCLRPCERLPLGFSHWGDFMRSSGMSLY